MDLVKEIVSILIYAIITGCGVVIVKKVLDYANAKIDDIQKNTQLSEYTKLNEIIDKAQGIVTEIVTSINQTFTDSLKASGEFTKDSATIAKDAAVDKANELINEEAVKAIETVYGDFDSWLDVNIEAIVNKLKK